MSTKTSDLKMVAHSENIPVTLAKTGEAITGFDSTTSNMPKGYFYSPYFLGTMAAIGLSLMGSVGGFALAAPILGYINADIGPDPNITWVPLVFPLGLAVGLTLVGRLSDLFGRRWFFTAGQGLGCVGAIVCATAQSVPTLIGGTAIVGIAASTALSFSFLTGELVPMKYRFIGTAYAYLWVIPFSGLAPAIANSLVVNANWRWCYYLMIIFDALAFLAYFFFYHPPTFDMKHRNARRREFIRNFDYIGTILFSGGMVVFLLGLSWGGNVYPWASPAVISTCVIGGIALIAFTVWECYAKLQEPLVPMHLFRNRDYNITCILLAIGASVYYAFGIVWPSMVNVIYADGDAIYAGWLQCCVGGAFTLGQVVGGFLCEAIGNSRLQIIVTTAIGGALLGGKCGRRDVRTDSETANHSNSYRSCFNRQCRSSCRAPCRWKFLCRLDGIAYANSLWYLHNRPKGNRRRRWNCRVDTIRDLYTRFYDLYCHSQQ